jgi:hypothetical protein
MFPVHFISAIFPLAKSFATGSHSTVGSSRSIVIRKTSKGNVTLQTWFRLQRVSEEELNIMR